MTKPKEIYPSELAEFMHEAYEWAAQETGWKTQDSCRVPFKDLPFENKQTMLKVAVKVLDFIQEAK